MPFNLKEEFVIHAESQLGAGLPDSYRKSMMRSNGGEIAAEDDDWFLYPIADTSDRKRLARSCNSIVAETEAHKAWPNFPAHAVAIGNNGRGDLLVMLKAEKTFAPAVYAWRHEGGQMSKIADDFSDLDKL